MTAEFFVTRGAMEGFYGRPWTHQQRLDMIEFIAHRGMNTFLYSPKDDPFLRQRWREPYDSERLGMVSALQVHASQHGVDLIVGLSPGLSMRYSSGADLAVLVNKLQSLCDAGVTHVALLFDDIPARLQHPGDIATFTSIAEAHAATANAVGEALGNRATLFVCPLQYWGRGDEAYISVLGQRTDPGIEIMWTGTAICSQTLDVRDAAVISGTLNRLVTYWDNYPVNDVSMTHELHVGPYRGREADLGRFSRGIIANAMELFESSKIGVATVADYLSDPHAYDPERSFDAAIDAVAGPYARAYRLFADNCRSSCLSAEDAPIVTRAIEELTFGVAYGDAAAARAEFTSLVDELAWAAGELRRGIGEGVELLVEAEPWIDVFAIGVEALRLIGDAAGGSLDTDALRAAQRRLRSTRERVFGDTVVMAIDDYLRSAEEKC